MLKQLRKQGKYKNQIKSLNTVFLSGILYTNNITMKRI